MTISLKPINDLRRTEKGWQALDSDPHFYLQNAAIETYPPGWYRFSAKLKTNKGLLIHPSLYFDFGTGFSEASKTELRFGEDADWYRGQIVLVPANLKNIRLDPSTTLSEFSIEDICFEKTNRVSAAISMVKALWKRFEGKRAKLEFFSNLVEQMLSFDPRQIGEWLWSDYNKQRDVSYSEWLELYESNDRKSSGQIAEEIQSWPKNIKFSIVLPVYNTPEHWLKRCIESVIAQTYPNWELCIADDASTLAHIKKVLEQFAEKDSRIKLAYRKKNGHISAASNTALEMATGNFVVLLDHDDEIPDHALYEVAKAIQANPGLKVIYSDEDKIDSNGQRYDPYFKPDWNYDLFLSQNCISHLGVYDLDLVRSIGGFREGFEGSQDYDLSLRCIEKIDSTSIWHIPKILYHWRAVPGSTALGARQKSYALVAAKKTISEHLERIKVAATVESTTLGFQKISYHLPENSPLMSLIIPTKDRVDLLKMSIGSIIEKTEYQNYEIIIIDNNSSEKETFEYFDEVRKNKKIRVFSYPHEFNFSAINNFAVSHANGEVLGLINNDIEVINATWLSEMLSQALRPGVGAVGAMLYYPDDTIQHAGVIVGLGGVAGHSYSRKPRGFYGQSSRATLTQNLSAVTAACMVVKRSVYQEVSGFDEGLQVAFNDIDFCLRVLQKGYRNVWTPFAELYHHESVSRGYEDTPEKKVRFQSEVLLMKKRWGDILDKDPAYNPNLTLTGYAFDLAYPPRHLS
jgi:O-antigen biosynthesis protein